MQFHFEFPSFVERLGENVIKHAHEKCFSRKIFFGCGGELNPGIWIHNLTLYQLSHQECWWFWRFFVYLNPLWAAFAFWNKCMHSAVHFFEFLTVGQERLRDMQMHLRSEQKKKSRRGGIWTQVYRFTIQRSTNWAIRDKDIRGKRQMCYINKCTKTVQRGNVKEVVPINEQSVSLALSASPLGLLRRPIKDWQLFLWFHGLLYSSNNNNSYTKPS